ncbi:MAG: hypothetical protein OXF84_05890 [Bacteroidetes bacterium]|nr:hypothetical protein [Bacteroidota bacterium]
MAESKPYQLYIAAKCGFNVPKTCISNDVQEIKTQFHNLVAIKSLDTVLIHEGSEYLFTYTSVMDTSDISAEISQSVPVTTQMLLKDKVDIRVTIIGHEVYSVKILTSGQGIDGDWRLIPHEYLQFLDFQLSEKLHQMCLKFMQKLGLSYAAIDLIETGESIYFIEVNPTGEWGWLNQNTRPIATTIASWLENPTNHKKVF